MNPLLKQKKKDLGNLTPEQRRRLLFPDAKVPKLPPLLAQRQDRKYFDSGDYALSKAGKQPPNVVGTAIPTPMTIPHPHHLNGHTARSVDSSLSFEEQLIREVEMQLLRAPNTPEQPVGCSVDNSLSGSDTPADRNPALGSPATEEQSIRDVDMQLLRAPNTPEQPVGCSVDNSLSGSDTPADRNPAPGSPVTEEQSIRDVDMQLLRATNTPEQPVECSAAAASDQAAQRTEENTIAGELLPVALSQDAEMQSVEAGLIAEGDLAKAPPQTGLAMERKLAAARGAAAVRPIHARQTRGMAATRDPLTMDLVQADPTAEESAAVTRANIAA